MLEQHWELLAKQVTRTSSVTQPIRRGLLPGSTTKFDPAPTATYEVVAKVAGATGGAGWTITLRDFFSQDVVSVTFNAGDSNYQIKTATLSWPVSNTDLYEMRIDSFKGSASDLIGTLDIRKAYIKLSQSGTIKKTVGRFPIAAFQDQVGATAFTNLDDEEVFEKLPRDPKILKDLFDLPGDAPLVYRYLEPPVGTPIQRGIVPGGEFGGTGGYPEVFFPKGF